MCLITHFYVVLNYATPLNLLHTFIFLLLLLSLFNSITRHARPHTVPFFVSSKSALSLKSRQFRPEEPLKYILLKLKLNYHENPIYLKKKKYVNSLINSFASWGFCLSIPARLHKLHAHDALKERASRSIFRWSCATPNSLAEKYFQLLWIIVNISKFDFAASNSGLVETEKASQITCIRVARLCKRSVFYLLAVGGEGAHSQKQDNNLNSIMCI